MSVPDHHLESDLEADGVASISATPEDLKGRHVEQGKEYEIGHTSLFVQKKPDIGSVHDVRGSASRVAAKEMNRRATDQSKPWATTR